MKYYTFLLAFILAGLIQACDNNDKKGISTNVVKNTKSAVKIAEDGSAPEMQFEEIVHSFGEMIQGERVSYGFNFVNVGGSDLVITRVSTSCGCAVGEYPKEPIPPGEEGVIEVTFDSSHKKGYQNKTITVLANTEPNSTVLRIKATVIMPQNN